MLALVAAFVLATPAGAQGGPPKLDASSWVLADERSGDVLAQRASGEGSPIASATKMMTAVVALRKLRPGERVVAAGYAANPGESLMGLRPGERISVRALLQGLLMASGNDAAATLAEAAAGSSDAFVRMMNARAERLGLEATAFEDPIGLSAGNVSSAVDLVRLASELRAQPLLAEIVNTARVRLAGKRRRIISNRNTLVRDVPWVDGVKTGFTDAAGYVLVSSGMRKGIPLVAAVLGAPNEEVRDAESLELLRFGASLYEERTLVERGERVAAPALELRDEVLPLRSAGAVRATIRSDQTVSTDLDFPGEVEGPVKRGERLGSARVTVDGEEVGVVALVAARSASAPSALDRLDGELPGGRATVWVLAAGAILLLGAVLALVVVALRRAR